MLARLILTLTVLGLTTAPMWADESRVALVIGNGAYQNADSLKNPVNDARAMAARLRTLGFEVIVRENASRRVMIEAMRAFATKLTPGGVGLFFYAGHGMQAKGANYLLPVDAALAAEDDLKYETFDIADVLGRMEDARTRLNLIILDACRDNPFARGFRSATRGLAQIDAPRGTVIAFATAPGKTAADGDGDNGLYTSELLKAMARPGLKLEDVLKRAADGVEQRSASRQTPWMSSSFRGDFYFLGPTTITVMPPPPASISREAQEASAWDAVKGSTTAGPFQAFLERFPDGIYGDIARAKIKEMTALAPATRQPAAPSSPLPPGPGTPGAGRGARDCAEEKQLRSFTSSNSVTLTMRNLRASPVRAFWLDFGGGRVFYMKLEAGQSYSQQTFATHPWVITDAAGACITVFVPDAASAQSLNIQ